MTVGEFFNSSDYQQLKKPYYQRPYEWTPRNVRTLLEDLLHFQQEKAQGYRLGCIILCRNKENKLDIVDGQQRLITLWLIRYYLGITTKSNHDDAVNDFDLNDATSKNSLKNAWFAIKDWMESHSAAKDDLKQLLSSSRDSSNPNCVEIVVIQVTNQEEAFQLFDSQNSRGQPLKVHHYLKARHLGCMSDEELQHADSSGLFEGWMDRHDSEEMKSLLNRLFKIQEWSHRRTRTQLTESNMDQFFYGFMGSGFSYQKHYVPNDDYFELGRPFKAGKEFFLMIKYFRCLSQQIEDCCFPSGSENGRTKIRENYNKLKKWGWGPNGKEAGWSTRQLEPCRELFRAAALLYCNRFGLETFPEKANILFVWALSLRYAFRKIYDETLDDFAVGNKKDRGLQPIAWFERMSQAL